MRSPTFTIALQRQLAHRRRRHAAHWQDTLARQREANARAFVADVLCRQAAYVYGLYGMQPPPHTRDKIVLQLGEQAGFSAYALLAEWAKAGLRVAESRVSPTSDMPAQPNLSIARASHREDPVLIKRYAGRRLYDTVRGQYVTRDEVVEMARAGVAVVVQDAKTGADVTAEIVRPA